MKNMKKRMSPKMSKSKKVATVAGLAALGAGAYYLLGPNAKAHQKKTGALLAKMKKDVQDEIKKAEKVTIPLYHKAVDIVSKNYAKQYKLHEPAIKAFAKKLKSKWKDLK
jgi:D-alanyl-D-alanine dipeptidase